MNRQRVEGLGGDLCERGCDQDHGAEGIGRSKFVL